MLKSIVTMLITLLTLLSGMPERIDNTMPDTAIADKAVADTAVADKAADSNLAAEVSAELGLGWNLGNTLDAHVNGVTGLASETSWGNPKTTRKLIQYIKSLGFNTIRIPVTWQDHMGKAPDYKVDPAWMKRVHETADYVLDEGMYAIVNVHHDGENNGGWLKPDTADKAGMYKQFKALWSQIAAEFKDEDEHLLFAGMNEFQENFNSPTPAQLTTADELNQLFVDTVRAAGGHNKTRVLVVQPYNTNIEAAMKMKMPTDTAKNALMVEVHSYDPWNFAGEGQGKWTETQSDNGAEALNRRYEMMKTKFSNKGIPVMIGEYGCVERADTDSRIAYIRFTTSAMVKHSITPIVWDDGGGFSFVDRYGLKLKSKTFCDAIMEAKKYL
jgi:endoglucanase